MKILHAVLILVLVSVISSTPIHAEEHPWTLRVHGAIIESSVGTQSSIEHGFSSSVKTGGGFGVGIEFRLSDRIGLEASVLFGGVEIKSSLSSGQGATQSLNLNMMPVNFAVPFHFDIGGRADLYAAVTFGVVRYLDIEWSYGAPGSGIAVDVDSDTAFGAALGLDVPFGKGRWAWSAGLRYMKTGIKGTDVDPLVATLGVAFQF